ncbi:MAG: cytochrome bc complex cytochrome b subunit [Desulfatitalea sp.]|nr:cytochrome b N-terminal domain-containing protein [Desulfatitalea sp.]NNK02878.1 cytochrome bc complex cytochrome b subunit [Desulfatitalea sp.]
MPEKSLKLAHTWGLGGMALLLVILQVLSGSLMLFVYHPVPDKAYHCVWVLMNAVTFGRFIRGVHYWSANVLVAVVLLHMLRVFFTSAFHSPRRFNWIIGLCLLGFVLVSNFTGYLLPWDQLAYWAVTICIEMLAYIPWIGVFLKNLIRGGGEIGSATLSTFFVFHVILMPVCFFTFMPFHFWRVRKAGGVVSPKSLRGDVESAINRVPVLPHLVVREAAVGLVLVACVFMLSAIFDAPLESQANPGLSPNPTKAPWYFVGFQELQLHLAPEFAILVFPLIFVAGLMLIPYLSYGDETCGVWFCSQRGRRSAGVAGMIGVTTTLAVIFIDEWVFADATLLAGGSGVVMRGILPLGILFFGGCMFAWWGRRKGNMSTNEVVQSIFAFFLSAFVMLTLIGALFRGPGMALAW